VIVALSQALEDDLRANPRVRSRLIQIPNGVDTALFRPARGDERARARERFALPEDAFVIVTCGMLYRRKNVVALVHAAAAMRQRPLHVVMAGPPGPEADYLQELDEAVAALPEGVAVHRPGFLEADALAELHRAADAFVLMSRAEGLPNALLEAMASGLACVASDIPGSADVLAGGGGLRVPLDDDAGLAAVLDRLAADPPERARLGAQARLRAQSEYSFSSIAERYRQVYLDLL
jgi:glycosyltransferase involved in cell wall biosynthesis